MRLYIMSLIMTWCLIIQSMRLFIMILITISITRSLTITSLFPTTTTLPCSTLPAW